MVLISHDGQPVALVTIPDAIALVDDHGISGVPDPSPMATHYYCHECRTLHPQCDLLSRATHRLKMLRISCEVTGHYILTITSAAGVTDPETRARQALVEICIAPAEHVREVIKKTLDTPPVNKLKTFQKPAGNVVLN